MQFNIQVTYLSSLITTRNARAKNFIRRTLPGYAHDNKLYDKWKIKQITVTKKLALHPFDTDANCIIHL